MEITSVNPWPWSLEQGFSQGQLVEGATRQLFLAGQTSVNELGEVQHAGDMGAQIQLALENVKAVLAGAGMTLANVVRLNFYSTDVDSFLQNAGALAGPFGEVGVAPAGTLLGVTRLAFPGLMIELEATAVA
jgi:enamine deaminase RidA (YjgF/YER057c/UK114 family)